MNNVTILPADIYQVINKNMLTEYDKYVLRMLYMPIIGNTAVTLYLMLSDELNGLSISNELTHRHLMSQLGISLEEIKNSRIKLEGIGLLKTYYMNGSINSFVYELYSPITPEEFFTHPIFNMVLYTNVGKSEYEKIKSYFKKPKIDLNGYIDITSPFDMTFKSENYTTLEVECDIVKKEKMNLNFNNYFDFDYLVSSMPKGLFNEKCLTKSNKELINNLSFLYNLDESSMCEIIKASLNEKGVIVSSTFKNNVRKYYQINNAGRLPSLIFKKQPDYLKSNKISGKRGRIIEVFETTTPYNFLKAKYKGVKPTNRDMEILEMLSVEVKLKPSVVNVLIDYVLKTSNNKLVKSFIETIAGQWKRLDIQTASEAMDLAEKEHKKYSNNKTKTKVVEKVPVWFNESNEKKEISDKEKKELEDLLKEYK